MNKYINKTDKLYYWDYYILVHPNPKDYETITRGKMVEEIRDYFKCHKEHIAEALGLKGIRRLLEGNQLPNYKDVFLYEDVDDNGSYTIRTEFIEFLELLIIDDQMIERDYFENVLRGMIKVYGGLRFDTIDAIYENQRDKKYSHLQTPTVNSFKYLKDKLFYDEYKIYSDAVLHPLIEANNLDEFISSVDTLYPLDYFYEYHSLGFPKKIYENLLNEHNYTHAHIKYLSSSMNKLLQIDDSIVSLLYDVKKGSNLQNYSRINKHKEILLTLPIWKLGGKNYLDYLKTIENSTLTLNKQKDFIKFIDEIILYGNKKYRYIPNIRTLSDLHKVMDDRLAFKILCESIEKKSFIDKFIASKSYSESEFIEEFLDALKSYITIDKGYAYKYTDDKLLIYHENKVYHLSGITEALENLLPKNQLPVLISTIIFPLYDCTVYGLSFSTYGIQIGKNMQDMFNKEIATAKNISQYSDVLMVS